MDKWLLRLLGVSMLEMLAVMLFRGTKTETAIRWSMGLLLVEVMMEPLLKILLWAEEKGWIFQG